MAASTTDAAMCNHIVGRLQSTSRWGNGWVLASLLRCK